MGELEKKIKRLEELSDEYKSVEISFNGSIDSYEADPDWIQNWGSEIMDILKEIDKDYKTSFANKFMNIQAKFANINWRYRNSSAVGRCLDNSKSCLKEIIEEIKKL